VFPAAVAVKVPVAIRVLPVPPNISVALEPCTHADVEMEPVMPLVLLA